MTAITIKRTMLFAFLILEKSLKIRPTHFKIGIATKYNTVRTMGITKYLATNFPSTISELSIYFLLYK